MYFINRIQQLWPKVTWCPKNNEPEGNVQSNIFICKSFLFWRPLDLCRSYSCSSEFAILTVHNGNVIRCRNIIRKRIEKVVYLCRQHTDWYHMQMHSREWLSKEPWINRQVVACNFSTDSSFQRKRQMIWLNSFNVGPCKASFDIADVL